MTLVVKPTTIAEIKSMLTSQTLNDGRAVKKPVTVVSPIVDPVSKVLGTAR
jgi:hypothetical protein